jgi:hypothetical protein
MVMKKINLPKILQPFQTSNLIRLGKDNDGGYLINKTDVTNTKTILSFGIGEDYSFEEQFLQINDCNLYAYDSTVTNKNSKEYIEFFKGKRLHIDKKVGIETKPDTIAVSDILSLITDSIFVKCDIEGNEYSILDELIKHSNKFTGLVIEFHDLHKYENFNLVADFVSKLNQRLIHVHINNYMYYKVGELPNQTYVPDVIELVFSSDTNLHLNRNIKLPHHLDMPNNPNDDEFEIIFL